MRFLSLLLPGTLAVVLIVANEARAAVAFGNSGAVDTGNTTLVVPHPTGIVAGDLLVLAVGNKYPTNGPATPAGWTLVTNGQISGGVGAQGADSGTVYATVFVKVADGTESGTDLTVTLTGADTSMGRMFRYTNAAGSGWEYAATNGSDNVTGTTWSVTGAADPGITAGDMLIVVSAINGNRFSGWASESVSATGATFTTHTERHDSSSKTGDAMALVVTDHTVTAGTASAAPVFTMTGTGTATTNTPTGASVILRIREVPGTTLGASSETGTVALGPGGARTLAGEFTFRTSSGTDTITDVTVGLGTGAGDGLSLVEITDLAGTTLYGSTAAPISDTPTITLGSPNSTLIAGTSSTTYRIYITPKTHPNMPLPSVGVLHSVSAKINTWTGTNVKLGSDTAGITITIDNASPLGASPTSGTAGNAQVTLNWTTSASADFSRSVVLRWDGSTPGTEVPAEGTDYVVGAMISTATVVCVRTADGPSTAVSGTDGLGTGGCSATALTNGQAYSYTVFQKDTNGNYDVGVTFSGSPFTPFGPGCYAVASASWDLASTWASTTPGGTPGTCPGTGNVPDASTPVFIGETSTAYNVTIPATYTARAASVTLGSNTANAKSLTLLAATASLEVGGGFVINNPSNTNTNALNVNDGTVTVGSMTLNGTSANNGRVARINITAGTLTINGGLTYNAANSARAVINMAGGAGTLNLAGALTVNTTGTLTPGTTSTFNFNGTSAAQTIPIGVSSIVYNHLHVNNTSSGGATLGNNDVTATRVTGNLNIQSGKLNDGGFIITGGTGDTFNVANGASFIYTTNTWVSGFTRTFGATSTVDYARAGGQTVANESYGHLTLSNSGTKTLPGGTLNIAGNLSMSGTAAINNNNGTVNMNGSIAQTISLNSTNSNLNNLTIANTAATVSADSNIVMDGNFTINASGTFSAGSFLHSLAGNFTNNGALTAGTSTFTFNDTNNPQTIGGASPTTFYNLTVSNTDGGGNELTLNINTTVNNTLSFVAGNVLTGSNILIIGNTTGCGVTGAAVNRHVIGYLRKNFTASLLDCTFEVGEGTVYAPVRMVFNSVTTPDYVTASTTVGDHPQIATSSINSSLSVNRYWTLTQGGGLVFGSYIATFNYNASDLDGGVTPDDFTAQRYDGGGWFNTSLSSTAPPSGTATVIEGETGFGDFAVGESSITGFSYEREFIFTREIYY